MHCGTKHHLRSKKKPGTETARRNPIQTPSPKVCGRVDACLDRVVLCNSISSSSRVMNFSTLRWGKQRPGGNEQNSWEVKANPGGTQGQATTKWKTGYTKQWRLNKDALSVHSNEEHRATSKPERKGTKTSWMQKIIMHEVKLGGKPPR